MRLQTANQKINLGKNFLRIISPFKRHRSLNEDLTHLISIFMTVPIAFHPGFSESNFIFAIAVHLLIRALTESVSRYLFKTLTRIQSGLFGLALAGFTVAFSVKIFQSAAIFHAHSHAMTNDDLRMNLGSNHALWLSWFLLSLSCSLAQGALLVFFKKNHSDTSIGGEDSTVPNGDFWLRTLLVSLGLLSSNHLTGEIFRIFAELEPSPKLFALVVAFFSVGIILLRKLLRELLSFRLLRIESPSRFSFGIVALFALSAAAVCVFSFGKDSLLLQFSSLLFVTLLTGIISEEMLISGATSGDHKRRIPIGSSTGSSKGKQSIGILEAVLDRASALFKNPRTAGTFFLGIISFFVGLTGLHRTALPLLFCFFTIASVTIGLLHALEEQPTKPIDSVITQAVSRIVLFVFLSVFCTESIYSIVKAGREADRRENAIVRKIGNMLTKTATPKDRSLFEDFSRILSDQSSIKCGRLGVGKSVFQTCQSGHHTEVRTIHRKELLPGSPEIWFELSFDHSTLWIRLAKRVGVIFFLLLIFALTTLYASMRFSRSISSQLGSILNSINRDISSERTDEKLSSDMASFKQDLEDLLEIRKVHQAQVDRLRAAEQVEHDIRSPLFVLRAILPRVDGVSEDEKRALIQSVEKIAEITKDLRASPYSNGPWEQMKKPISEASANPSPTSDTTAQFESMTAVKSALESLITEKHLEHSKRNPIHLDFDRSLESLGLFAKKETFARVISNLLNNAIEASPAKSGIVVSVRLSKDQSLVLSVMDQGKGISGEDLKHLGVRGFTRGKADGSGLGLWSAREFLAGLGAHLEVDSMVDVGTTVSMLFPRECWAMVSPP